MLLSAEGAGAGKSYSTNQILSYLAAVGRPMDGPKPPEFAIKVTLTLTLMEFAIKVPRAPTTVLHRRLCLTGAGGL